MKDNKLPSEGTFYGLGIGPGDPELITIKAKRIIENTRNIFVPKSRLKSESLARDIIKDYILPSSRVEELVFPMSVDCEVLSQSWENAAQSIAKVLKRGEDACFVTLGDPFLYSTYIYLLRALKKVFPSVNVTTVPGITSFCAAASLTSFSLADGNDKVVIFPVGENLNELRFLIEHFETVILMKVAKMLDKIIVLLEEMNILHNAVFVSRAGQAGETVVFDMKKLKNADEKKGYLSIVLIRK